MEIITTSAKDTFELGKKIGATLEGGEVLALSGDLGSGKTTFIQGLAVELGITQNIVSPTFILMRIYPVSSHKTIKKLLHLDIYRLEDSVDESVRDLGVADDWKRDDTVVVIEWADKIRGILPQGTKWIHFDYTGEDQRRIKVTQ